MVSTIQLLEGETSEQYISRIITCKLNGDITLTWGVIAGLINSVTGVDKAGDTWRKSARKYYISDEVEEAVADSDDLQALKDILKDISIERVMLSDERTQNRAYIRRIAREKNIAQIAENVAKEISSKKILAAPRKNAALCDYNEAIVQLSDWHYGIEVNNHWNTFNPDICVERVAKLRDEVIAFCKLFKVRKLHVVNLSDLIAGRIHSTIRLESRCDVITQTIKVAEILAEFLSDLTEAGLVINYYDCLDNHSRLEPMKAESLELESLVRIVPWYLITRLKGYPVTICENEFSDDIITFKVLNGKYKVAGVHGHKDKPGRVVEGLTLMTKNHYDMILTAHLHHFSGDEKNESLVISNGSLMGTDAYAKDLRLCARASQNIILVNDKSVADYIHRIVLN